MANVYAIKTGNWSDTTVWNTGALPTSADDVYSNNFTVTINISPTVLSIRNAAATGITAGGTFLITTAGITLAAAVVASGVTLLTVSVASPGVTTINGACTGGSSASAFGVVNSGSGTLTISGNCTGGTGSGANAVNNTGTGTVNITGTCTSSGALALSNSSTATATINGACTGGSGGSQAAVSNSGTLTISGNCTGGAGNGASAVNNTGTGTVNITGTCTGNGATALTNGSTATATINGACTGGTGTNQVAVSNSGTLTISGNCTGGSGSAANAVNNTGTGTVNITGTCTSNNGLALGNSSTGTATINGACTGGTGTNHVAVSNTSTGTLTISGDCTGGAGSSAHAVSNSVGGTVNITGTCRGSGGHGAINYGVGNINITGNCIGSSTNSIYGASNAGTGTISITGDCTGGNGTSSHGANNGSTGRINITGTCTGHSATSSSYGANNASTGTLNHIGTVQASAAPGIGGAAGASTLLTGPFLTESTGVSPVYALRWQWVSAPISPTYYEVRRSDLVMRPLYTLDSFSAGTPAVSNVRSGTTYGPNNSLVGTLAVPPTGSVLLGVPVDNTTGTATITSTDIRAALGMSSANLDTQLSALSSGQTTINNNVSTRLAASSYTAPPTVTQVRQEIDANSTKLDVAVSSRLASSGYTSPPSAASNASAVRTELSTELARIDAAISTRLAGSAYVVPPTASAIATAVNSALDRTGYSLTSQERQAIATAVEQSILNENDGQAILNAIVGAIGNQNIDQIALVAAIRADLERNGGTLATRSTLTAAQVRTELAPELGNMDATVSSRLPTSGYAAPPSAVSIAAATWSNTTRTLTANPGPSAADNATAVRAELSVELSRVDATVSSRLKPSDTLARVTLTDTATTLTNAPIVPTPAQIADEVRIELTPELSRVANCATTQEVGDIVEGALSG